jgi:hypothetical protein
MTGESPVRRVLRFEPPDFCFLVACLGLTVVSGVPMVSAPGDVWTFAGSVLYLAFFWVAALGILYRTKLGKISSSALEIVGLVWISGVLYFLSSLGYDGIVQSLGFQPGGLDSGILSLGLFIALIVVAAVDGIRGPRGRGAFLLLFSLPIFWGGASLVSCRTCTGGGTLGLAFAVLTAAAFIVLGQLTRSRLGIVFTVIGSALSFGVVTGLGMLLGGYFLAARTLTAKWYRVFVVVSVAGAAVQIPLVLLAQGIFP